MARIPLGGLTTLNLGAHLDPMFIELYAAAGGGYTTTSTFTIGDGTGMRVINLNGGTGAAEGSAIRFQRGGVNGFIVGDGGGVLGSGAGDGVLLANGATNIRAYTNGAERLRIDSAGNIGVNSTAPTVGGTGPILDLYHPTTQPAITFHNGVSTLASSRGGMIRYNGSAFELQNLEASGTVSVFTNGFERLRVEAGGVVRPASDNTQTLGAASFRWSTVYAGTGAINTSDAREKTEVQALTANEIAAAQELAAALGKFKFLQAVADKGDDARTHIGMTVQGAMDIMESHGLDPFDYAFICYDQWGSGTADDPSGDRYSFRSDELALFIAAGQQAAHAALEARIAALEAYDK